MFRGGVLYADNTSKLDEITIEEKILQTTGYLNQFKQETFTGSKLGLTIKETPANIEVLSTKTMSQRGDSTVVQAVSKVVGIQAGESGHGPSGKYGSRGFVAYPGVTFLNNGIKTNSSIFVSRTLDIANLDKIEVIKGANSIFNGESSIGATINLITKKPSFTKEESGFILNYGSFDSYRAKFGVGDVVIDDKLAYRLDISSRKQGFNIKGAKRDIDSISLSMLYRFNDNLFSSISFDRTIDNGKNIYSVTPLINGKLDKSVKKENYNIYSDNKDRGNLNGLRYETEYYPANNFEIKNLFYYSNLEGEMLRAYKAIQKGDKIEINGNDLYTTETVIGNKLNLLYIGDIFNLKNKFSIGFDFSTSHMKRDMTRSFAASNYLVDIYNPSRIRFGDSGGFYRTKNMKTDINQYSLYLEDQLNLTNNLKFIVGLRNDILDVKWDYIQENKKKDKTYKEFSYRTGFVYDISPSIMLYATYSEAFENGGSSLAFLSSKDTNFDLTKVNQQEVGIKSSFFDDRAELTLSAYKINKKNMYIADPNNAVNKLPIGKRSSKGYEFSFGFTLSEYLQLDTNLAYTNARYDYFISGVNNLSGKVPNSVPNYIANLGLSYVPIPNLDISTWVRYVDSFYVDDKNTMKLPSYTIFDLILAYKYNKNTAFNFIVKNVTDKLYATSTNNRADVFLGEPRSFEFGLSYKF